MLEFAKLKAYESAGELTRKKSNNNQQQNNGIEAYLCVCFLYIGNKALKKIYLYSTRLFLC